MAPPRGAARRRLDELLADGNWHERDRLIADTVGVIPPGVAVRRARSEREGCRRRDAEAAQREGRTISPGSGGAPPGDDRRVGARMIVRESLNHAVRLGAYERRVRPTTTVDTAHPATTEIRLAPNGAA